MGSAESINEKLSAIKLNEGESDNDEQDLDQDRTSCCSSQDVLATQPRAVAVHSLTERPDKLYKQLSQTDEWKNNYKVLEKLPQQTPKPKGHVRFVCISDTHNRHDDLTLPDGDILLHAGDFTWKGTQQEVENFCKFLDSVRAKYKHIVVIAGNHELSFDDMEGVCFGLFRKKSNCNRGSDLKAMLKKYCIYLEDEETELMGFRIYGSPWYVQSGGKVLGWGRHPLM